MTRKQKHLLARIVIAAILFFAGSLFYLPEYMEAGIFLICYIVVGWDIVWKAITNILHGQVFDENFLMTIATIGALVLGEHSEGVAVMLFYQVGEWFQSYAVSKSRKSIASLMDIRPDYANVQRNGELIQVDPDEVQIGDTIIVKPGERIPLDGTILKGSSALDTSALTGESMPREVEPGMEVISGCINQTGILTICTTKEFGESTVAKILDLVENASDYPLCPLLHPCCSICGISSGNPSPIYYWTGIQHMDLPGINFSGYLLSLCACYLHTA